MSADTPTIKGNWPVHHCTNGKVFDPYEARAVENLLGTIADLLGDGHIDSARLALRHLAERFDTRTGDTLPAGPQPERPRVTRKQSAQQRPEEETVR